MKPGSTLNERFGRRDGLNSRSKGLEFAEDSCHVRNDICQQAEMPDLREAMESRSTDAPTFKLVVDILGGPKVLKWKLKGPLDAHELLLRGLPGAALSYLVDSLVLLHDPVSLEKAIGISLRTFQRRKADPSKRLSLEQSGRAWKFAEILARATAVLGSRTEAEQWLERPAIGLDQRRPIDLLATTAGVEIVENHLERIEYGVYT
jgi:putative toxin-antitoxin system antitoxin component (TIGR02293 family)